MDNSLERRAAARWNVTAPVSLYDADRKQVLGRVINMSVQGMAIHSEHELQNTQYSSLWLKLPYTESGGDWLHFTGATLWSCEDREHGGYRTGFRFHTIAADTLRSLQGVIDELCAAAI